MTPMSNSELMRVRIIRWLALGVLLALPACAPFVTYPPDGSGPRTYPWMAPGPEVMATGLMQAHSRVAPDSPFNYNLPEGVSRTAWNDVQQRLGPSAHPMKDGDKVVWNLERFGIRNTRAFADVGYWNEGKGILITVSMERENVAPFEVTHIQRWYIAMEPPVSNAPTVDDPDESEAQDAAE